jgi:phosphoribosylglycinamide formyltransferase 1
VGLRGQRLAIFISGTGSNLGAALDMRDDVDIGLVVSSRKKALGVLKARRAGVPVHFLSNPVDWNELTKTLKAHNIHSIFLLGFMKILPESFVNQWKDRILNIHPSLLPTYPGLESIKLSFQDQKPMGITVHKVIPEMDAGPKILQRALKSSQTFELYKNQVDTENEFHRQEHRLVREVLAKWNRAVTLS